MSISNLVLWALCCLCAGAGQNSIMLEFGDHYIYNMYCACFSSNETDCHRRIWRVPRIRKSSAYHELAYGGSGCFVQSCFENLHIDKYVETTDYIQYLQGLSMVEKQPLPIMNSQGVHDESSFGLSGVEHPVVGKSRSPRSMALITHASVPVDLNTRKCSMIDKRSISVQMITFLCTACSKEDKCVKCTGYRSTVTHSHRILSEDSLGCGLFDFDGQILCAITDTEGALNAPFELCS
jgi:hypothetical protein